MVEEVDLQRQTALSLTTLLPLPEEAYSVLTLQRAPPETPVRPQANRYRQTLLLNLHPFLPSLRRSHLTNHPSTPAKFLKSPLILQKLSQSRGRITPNHHLLPLNLLKNLSSPLLNHKVHNHSTILTLSTTCILLGCMPAIPILLTLTNHLANLCHLDLCTRKCPILTILVVMAMLIPALSSHLKENTNILSPLPIMREDPLPAGLPSGVETLMVKKPLTRRRPTLRTLPPRIPFHHP